MKTLYTAHASTTSGRDGHTKTDDGKIDLDLSAPGSDGKGSNPEQLFACGYSACFGGAVNAVAEAEGKDVEEIVIDAEVSLHNKDESGGKDFIISVVLNAKLKGVDPDTARHLVEKAHHVCPYSKATRGNVEVILKVDGETLTQKKAA